MIDEELYQQAADELNSDRRRPHIWARACALASDDHDEARYLYTNLRVEELIAERENATSGSAQGTDSIDDTYSELSLVEEEDPDANDINDINDINGFLSEDSDDSRDTAQMDKVQIKEPALSNDPDEDLMVDYVPETVELLDDTYTANATDDDDTLIINALTDDTYTTSGPAEESYPDEPLAEEDFAQELASFKAEEGEPAGLEPAGLDTAGFDTGDLPSDAKPDSQSIPTLHNNAEIPDLTAAHPNDLTQANVDVLDAHADDLDEMLGETGYQAPVVEDPNKNVLWLDDESPVDKTAAKPANTDDPFVYDDDPLTDELSRQADELDLGSTANAVEVPVSDDTNLSVAAASGTAPASSPAAHVDNAAALKDPAAAASVWPMDLTEGDKGKLFSIYRRNHDAQAVKSGVSWSALFFTLPYLLYRHLFGTAFAYSLLWVIVVGGLILSGLAWMDAGASVTPLTQACAIGFALLAFIGLMYLPFRYGNIWRSERLENRGYELVAIAKAKNPGRAIARARRHAALDN